MKQAVVRTPVVNDAAFVSVPGEFFCESRLRDEMCSRFRYAFVTAPSNDHARYIPTAKAFGGGRYETFNARSGILAPRSGDKIVDQSLSVLNTLFPSPLLLSWCSASRKLSYN